MPAEHDWISYGEFGERFVRRAVTAGRVESALGSVAGKSVALGPISSGPLGFVQVEAKASVDEPVVRERPGDLVSFDATIPLSLLLRVRVGHEVTSECSVAVDLVLTARTAEPLLIVIDVPPVTADNVRVDLRASGLAAAALPFVDLLERDIRAQIARFVNEIVNDRARREARVFDIASRLGDGASSVPDQPVFCSYADFGAAFFRHAVTKERLSSSVDELAGRELSIGPLQAGPKDRATVTGEGTVAEPSLRSASDELVRFELDVPITLDLSIAMNRTFDYRCDIRATVPLVARAADDLLLVVDIPEVDPSDVDVSLTSSGLLGRALKTLGGLENQIRDQVADRINAETRDDSARVVDIGTSVDGG